MDAGFFDTLRSFKITSRKHRIADDDFVDRLNHYHTAILICLLAIIICAKQYIVGEPLQCWVPKEFSGGWEKYAENYCWVKNTYFVRPRDPLPHHTDRRKAEIQYYQWVPFVLGLQAALFYMPCIFWKLMNWQSGVHIKSLVEKANDLGNLDSEHRDKNLTSLVRHFSHSMVEKPSDDLSLAIKLKRMIFKVLCCGINKTGNYLITMYLISKLLYVGNIILQCFIMSTFLGTNYSFYGIEVVQHLKNGRGWGSTGHFPRVTYCDFQVRSLAHGLRDYTIQCVLVINLFNEKIYIFLWFWFVIILISNALSCLSWIVWLIVPGRKCMSVRRYLKGTAYEKKDVENFVSDLKPDGIFVLKMISINSGEIIVHDLIQRLFAAYIADRTPPTMPRGARPGLTPTSPPLVNPDDSWDPPQKLGAV